MNLLKQTTELKGLQGYLDGCFCCRVRFKRDGSQTNDTETITPSKEIRFLSKREALIPWHAWVNQL